MNALRNGLLALWVVSLAADRVNLLSGITPFVFTPFLALTPVVALSEWTRHVAGVAAGTAAQVGRTSGLAYERAFALGKSAIAYLVVAALFLAMVWASVSISSDPGTSLSRAALLSALVGGTFVVVALAADRTDLAAVLARGAVAGIAIQAAANVAQLAALFGAMPDVLRAGTVTLSLETVPYAGMIPRLSGLVADPNRTGWAMIVMAWLVRRGDMTRGVRYAAYALAAAVLLLTLSRSTLLAAAAVFVMMAVTQRRLRLPVGPLVAGAFVAAALGVLLFAAPPAKAPPLETIAPLAERFSSTEGSASEHLMLLRRGLDESTRSVPRFLMGIGYGAGFMVLQDRFPGNRYANFHSLYISLLAESGIFALLLMLGLLAWPLLRNGPYQPLVAGAAAFNLFYQTSAEPAFWMVLALAWMISESREPRTPRSG